MKDLKETKLECRLENAKAMQKIQRQDGNYNYDSYSLGIYNGMECIIATLEGREPEYIDGHKIKFCTEKEGK